MYLCFCSYLHECIINIVIVYASPVHAVHGDYDLVETVANIRPVASEIKIQRKCSCIIMVLLFDIIDANCYETGRCIIDWDV